MKLSNAAQAGDERMLSPSELAQLWGVSVYTIHRLANRPDGLKAYKIGSLTRFRAADVEAYLAANELRAPERQEPFPGMARFKYTPGMKVVSL